MTLRILDEDIVINVQDVRKLKGTKNMSFLYKIFKIH